MAEVIKILVDEIDGVDLEFSEERILSIQNIVNENPVHENAMGSDLIDVLTWARTNPKQFYKRHFTEQTIEVPSGKVLQMHSPIVDGEMIVDGEVYIL
jgi:hypothetical protein